LALKEKEKAKQNLKPGCKRHLFHQGANIHLRALIELIFQHCFEIDRYSFKDSKNQWNINLKFLSPFTTYLI